jgi:hypothetical protein
MDYLGGKFSKNHKIKNKKLFKKKKKKKKKKRKIIIEFAERTEMHY